MVVIRGYTVGRHRILKLCRELTTHPFLSYLYVICMYHVWGKVVRSKEYVDPPVWVRARDHLRVLEEPSVCATLLWPTGEGEREGLDISIPAYLLKERRGEAMGGWKS